MKKLTFLCLHLPLPPMPDYEAESLDTTNAGIYSDLGLVLGNASGFIKKTTKTVCIFHLLHSIPDSQQ